MNINALELISFKKIVRCKINLHPINILVGGNNSGKSSVLQGIHFSLGVGTTARSLGRDTFVQNDLLYCPASNFLSLRNGVPYENQTKFGFLRVYSVFSDFEGKKIKRRYEIKIYKGRNYGNVGCKRSGFSRLARLLLDSEKLFSIYVPGLAGIPQTEEYRTESIVKKAIASGGANFYLRNVLYLLKEKNLLDDLIGLMNMVFNNFDILVSFNKKKDEFITINVSTGNGRKIPLELVGTGVHQALQIFSYVTLYKPKVLLLDEPDAHLHPDNQILLAEALLAISTTSKTKIIISTHSKNIVDALYDEANLIWLKNGQIQEQGTSIPKLSMLMDIGALNDYGKLKDGEIDWVILTEDTKYKGLRILLEREGFDLGKIIIYSYNSSSKTDSAKYLAGFIRSIAPKTKVIIHRDRDFMTDFEVQLIKEKIQGNMIYVFITKNSDIESYYTNWKHIKELTGLKEKEVKKVLKKIRNENHNKLITKFTKKRRDTLDLYRNFTKRIEELKNLGESVRRPSTEDILGENFPIKKKNCIGKGLLKLLHKELLRSYNFNENLIQSTAFVGDPMLRSIRISRNRVKK